MLFHKDVYKRKQKIKFEVKCKFFLHIRTSKILSIKFRSLNKYLYTQIDKLKNFD